MTYLATEKRTVISILYKEFDEWNDLISIKKTLDRTIFKLTYWLNTSLSDSTMDRKIRRFRDQLMEDRRIYRVCFDKEKEEIELHLARHWEFIPEDISDNIEKFLNSLQDIKRN